MTIDPPQELNLNFESERLLFRPLNETDKTLSIELWTDPEITKYVGGPVDEQTLISQHKIYMRRCARGAIGVWTFSTKQDGEKLGTAILLPMPTDKDDTDWDLLLCEGLPQGEIEVGYILRKSAWGKGFATEACSALINFGFENTNLSRIVASTDDENQNSQNVLRKCGMQYLGKKLSYNEICPYFEITRAQWINEKHAN